MAPDTRIARTDTALSSEVEQTVVMMDIQNGKYFEMDGSAARIWSLLEQPSTFAELTAALAGEFDVSPAECEADTAEFIEELQGLGLVTIS